jgi:hypothetical protein
MRILLDESLPRRIRVAFPGHDVRTVPEQGWSGIRNGKLLQMAAEHFDLFVTADQNLQYQQNLRTLPLSVAVLVARENRLDSLLPATAELFARLPKIEPRTLVVCGG